jgi:hypothetical protein
MRWTSMRDWHLGQRGRTVARGVKVGICVWGMAHSLGSGGSVTELSVTGKCREWVGDASILPSAGSGHCSILLNFPKKFQGWRDPE